MSVLRAFCALEIPPDLQHSLTGRLQPLRESYPDGRWVAPHNLHLTLKFIGPLAQELVPEVARTVSQTAAEHQPFELRLAGAGVFGPAADPKVIWLGLREGNVQLARLSTAVAQALVPLGIAAETRPYRAHLTVARCRGGRLPPAFQAALAELAQAEWGSFVAKGVTLMRSELQPRGPVYTPLSVLPLGASPSVV